MLTGWKEILPFLKKTKRTLIRWKKVGIVLPVWKIGGSVFADENELRLWMKKKAREDAIKNAR